MEGVIWNDNSVSWKMNGKIFTTAPFNNKEEATAFLEKLGSSEITDFKVDGIRL
jgi:hypothetical protein